MNKLGQKGGVEEETACLVEVGGSAQFSSRLKLRISLLTPILNLESQAKAKINPICTACHRCGNSSARPPRVGYVKSPVASNHSRPLKKITDYTFSFNMYPWVDSAIF
jgi:hypothetical protein